MKSIVSFVASFLVLFGFAIPQINAQQPNVIVIVSDDAGYADFGFMNGLSGETSEIPTPNLDALATRGVTFSRAYVAQACQPTRAALVTGGYQNRIGNEVVGNNLTSPNGVYEGVPFETETIWERMKSIGYTTGAVGKWHLGSIADSLQPGNRPQRQGIDQFFGIWHGSRTYNVGNTNLSQTQLLREALVDPMGNITDTVVEGDNSGDYITNTFGDYAVEFIADHHDDTAPFFLYQSFTAPHTPLQNSPDFNDPSLAALTGVRKTYGSMMLTMDKEIGRILDRLNDPDGNGNSSDSIADNTLVIFINDNGGADENSSSPNGADNGILRRGKGSPWEGGIRVPMIIAGAGVNQAMQGTVYDSPVHGIDVLPTAFEAGGGAPLSNEPGIDGVNLLPFINGETSGDPHEFLVHRQRTNFSVIKGDWKLTWSGGSPPLNPQLYNLATDISETTNVAGANPSIVAELREDLTNTESEFDKQRFAILGVAQSSINLFDHFTFNPTNGFQNWRDANAWFEAGTNNLETMLYSDSFAGGIVEFPVSNSLSYSSFNDMVRLTGLETMLNKMVLSGDFNSSQNRTATIEGNDIMFTDSLLFDSPELSIDASDNGAGQFSFQIDTDIVLYNDFTITGNGNVNVNINGQIGDYVGPSSLTKSGTSTVTLTGANTFFGDTVIEAGTLGLAGGGSIHNSTVIEIQADATLDVSQNSNITLMAGQTLVGEGEVVGNIVASNNSEVQPAGSDTGVLNVTGNFSQQTGATLLIQLGVTGTDQLNVSGSTNISGGDLIVTLDGDFMPQDGQSFQILGPNGFVGEFDDVVLPTLEGGLDWNQSALATSGIITVGDPVETMTFTILGSSVGNADFEATEPFSGPQTYETTPGWFNGSGTEAINFTNDSQTLGSSQSGSRAGMPFQNRLQLNGTGYVVQAAGEVFSLTYDFGAGGSPNNWNGDEVMRTFLLTSSNGVTGDTTEAEMTELASDSYLIDRANDGQWTSYASSNLYTTSVADIGSTVYFGMVFEDASGPTLFPRIDVIVLEVTTPVVEVILGDVNLDGVVNLLDIAPFVELVSSGGFQEEADINQDGVVNLLDVSPFVQILSGG